MSLGSISREAHETLAIAMNRIGGKSNTGEGGEDPVRFTPDANGDLRRSAIKQVASGRFGVTIDYLTNADELQIKMAQGAKPGEGGQLPGHKVDRYIASVRLTTPGVGLISPPPHHDIYSIEDLKQLIYDLRCANPKRAHLGEARRRGRRRHRRGGRREGERRSRPDLRPRRRHRRLAALVDPVRRHPVGDRPRRDAADARPQRPPLAHLGADGRADQDGPRRRRGGAARRRRDRLRDRAARRERLRDDARLPPQHVPGRDRDPGSRAAQRGSPGSPSTSSTSSSTSPRRRARSWRGSGSRRYEDLVGRVDLLEADEAIAHWQERGHRPVARLLARPDAPGGHAGAARRARRTRRSTDALDWQLIEAAAPALERGEPVELSSPIRNVNRTVGGLLSHHVTKAHGSAGLPDGTIRVALTGSAGQSFGAWLAPGIELALVGDANDYVGKGLSGGTLACARPTTPASSPRRASSSATRCSTARRPGKAFFRGLAGERFAVRNSGATAVVEGVGDHGCEYMTGGIVVVLGPTGRNFAAGMSGGIAYVLDRDGTFASRCNMELVGFDPDRGVGRRDDRRARHRARRADGIDRRGTRPRRRGRDLRPAS